MPSPRAARVGTALAGALLLAACSSAPEGGDEGAGTSESSAIAGAEEPADTGEPQGDDESGDDPGPDAEEDTGDSGTGDGSGAGTGGDGDAAASGGDGPVALTCELADLAGDDPEAAARRFDVELHADLHELADERAEDDRAASARLLEAKNRVERLLADEPLDGEAIAGALEELAVTLAPDDAGCA